MVPLVLRSLYAQTHKPDRILLFLAEAQFPNKEADLPRELVEDSKAGRFELRWCDDLGSHKKYFYAMQEFPDDIIITVDDDTNYNPDMIKSLYELHLKHPSCVAALAAKMIMLDREGRVKPYKDWLLFSFLDSPSYRIIATGGNGVLYPPRALSPNVFDKQAILDHCRYNGMLCGDDLWLKMHGILAGTKTVTWKKRAFFQAEFSGASDGSITALSFDQSQHEQVLQFLLKRRGSNGAETVEEIFWQQEQSDRANRIHPEEKYLVSSYADDAAFVLITSLKRKLKEKAMRKLSLDRGYLIYLMRFANGAISRAGIGSQKRLLKYLQEAFAIIPNILELANGSFETRVLLFHGELLLTDLGDRFGQAVDYLQMLENWKGFFADHPGCGDIYRENFDIFLQNMKKAAFAIEDNGRFPEEAALLMKALEENRTR
ncbi:MAG: hypothetical protein IKI64_11550 [Clostridia bacterium]|nr:hypothetical protein [Clostridia bacterium]